MANPEHVKILKQGFKVWNKWKKDNPEVRPDLSGAKLIGAKLFETELIEADLRGAELIGADLRGANLNRANLNRANLNRANLSGAKLSGANLSGAELIGAKLFATELIEADLRGADLIGADLRGAKLHGAKLIEADIRGAKLSGADLSEADLFEAKLFEVELIEANLSGAKLLEVKLSGAKLFRAKLFEAKLRGANFKNAYLGYTSFSFTDLSEIKNIDQCQHVAPSSIDYHTLMKSENIPDIFLKGCGLSDDFIEYLPSLRSQALDYYSLFISYSTTDQDFTDRLYADLQEKGIRCWYTPHDISGGKKLYEQIDRGISIFDKLLLVLSDNSMKSDWVRTKIADARQKEIDTGKRILFPIGLVEYEEIIKWECFDADTGEDSAREIRKYFIPDFSNWMKDHKSYKKAFDKLISDLRGKEDKPRPKEK